MTANDYSDEMPWGVIYDKTCSCIVRTADFESLSLHDASRHSTFEEARKELLVYMRAQRDEWIEATREIYHTTEGDIR